MDARGAALYVALSVGLSLVATFLGLVAARELIEIRVGFTVR